MAVPLKQEIHRIATSELGFDDCRFTDPFLSTELDEYRDLVSREGYGDMGYLARHLPFKENPELLLPGVKSAIVVIKNYKNTDEKHVSTTRKIARYAVGKDYHIVIKDQLLALETQIKTLAPDIECYIGVDSRPLAERSLALKAGIGFRGRNTMVIKPRLGSYFLIGIMLTTYRFESDPPFKGSCGACRLCVDACPTGAISPDGELTPTACISYQTIEQKTPVDPGQLQKFNGWTFGCDICQEVCPFNHVKTPLTTWPEFMPESGVGFNFLDEYNGGELSIPKTSAMHRSRKRVVQNLT